MSLRARLLTGMVALVAAGLAIAASVTYEEQRSFLLTRVDQQVETAIGPIANALHLTGASGNPGFPGRRPNPDALFRGHLPARRGLSLLPPGTFGELRSPDGKVLRSRTFSYSGTSSPAPTLPAALPVSSAGQRPHVFTVQSTGANGASYRAVAVNDGANTAVVAVPLRETQDTLHRLLLVEALVGGGVILALIALGWLIIRIELRPLERIGRVASEIAGGDLSRRVTPADTRTEVGRLGLALNEMLAHIERAFRVRGESEDRLRRFLADASHELRTPLSSIRGYAELFRMGATDDPAALERAMSRIEAESARMGVLVEDLLLLTQLDEIPEGRRGRVDLQVLARHAADDSAVVAPDREITLTDDGPLMVLGDPDRLRQLLANLIRNAVIHTPPGTPIELTLGRAAGTAQLEVRDHGPGIPDAVGDQVFERFWRAEGGRSRGRGGAGLGLAIVRAIVTAHGGRVSAANAPDGGAVFRVQLPLAPRGQPGGGPPDGPDQEQLSGKSQAPHGGLLSGSRTVSGG